MKSLMRSRVVRLLVTVLVALSLSHLLTGSDTLTSGDTAAATLRLAVPLILAGLSGLWAERAGVINLGIEGAMIVGTWFAAWAAYQHGPWMGLALGAAAGIVFGLLHAVATVTFGVDHIISGVALNLLAAGLVRFLSSAAYADVPGAGVTQSPPASGRIPDVTVPVLAGGRIGDLPTPDVLGHVGGWGVPFISDTANIAHGTMTEVNLIAILTLAAVILTALFLSGTRTGLRLRSAGENPKAADSLGVAVNRLRYLAMTVSGALAGIAGAYLVIVASNVYREGQTGGRGFIGVAAMIFGNWTPSGTALGGVVFGFADALQLRQGDAVRQLFVFAAVLLLLWAAISVRTYAWRSLALTMAVAALAAGAYLTIETIPTRLLYATPYVVTLVVLAGTAQRMRPPQAVGVSFRRDR